MGIKKSLEAVSDFIFYHRNQIIFHRKKINVRTSTREYGVKVYHFPGITIPLVICLCFHVPKCGFIAMYIIGSKLLSYFFKVPEVYVLYSKKAKKEEEDKKLIIEISCQRESD